MQKRVRLLLVELTAIHAALTAVFGAIDVPLPAAANVPTLAGLKRYEDALDALVCAWVGARYAEGAAVGLGDATAAIWCPA